MANTKNWLTRDCTQFGMHCSKSWPLWLLFPWTPGICLPTETDDHWRLTFILRFFVMLCTTSWSVIVWTVNSTVYSCSNGEGLGVGTGRDPTESYNQRISTVHIKRALRKLSMYLKYSLLRIIDVERARQSWVMHQASKPTETSPPFPTKQL